MSSEVTHEVALVVGNSHARQRGSGHSVVSMIPWVPGHSAGQKLVGSRDEGTGKPDAGGVYVSRHFSLTAYGKACRR